MLNLFQHRISERPCDPDTSQAILSLVTLASAREQEEGTSSGRREINLILTTEAVLKKISTTDSPPEAVAIAKQKIFTLNDIKSAQKVVLLENIKDLGNLGTILRTANAFSQDAVILFGDTVDIYNPKCVRSTVGNLWKLPVIQIKDFSVLKSAFKKFEKVATLPRSQGTIDLKDFAAKSPYLIMFGSEAEGLSQELINFSTKKVTIEMNSEVESLNLSVSVGIILNALVG
jgi:TrmH family RNA methyltransferase